MRAAALLAAAWAGFLICIASAAALGFSTLQRSDAGRYANALFTVEGRVSLGACVLLIVAEKARAAHRAEQGTGSRFSATLVFVLGALACVIVGSFVLPSMLDASRNGRGMLSFAALHGVAALLFVVKTALALVVAWRLGATPGVSVAARLS